MYLHYKDQLHLYEINAGAIPAIACSVDHAQSNIRFGNFFSAILYILFVNTEKYQILPFYSLIFAELMMYMWLIRYKVLINDIRYSRGTSTRSYVYMLQLPPLIYFTDLALSDTMTNCHSVWKKNCHGVKKNLQYLKTLLGVKKTYKFCSCLLCNWEIPIEGCQTV